MQIIPPPQPSSALALITASDLQISDLSHWSAYGSRNQLLFLLCGYLIISKKVVVFAKAS